MRISVAPRILSLITRLSQSTVSWPFLNSLRTFASTTARVMPITGMMPSMLSPSRQLMLSNRALDPTMRKIDEIIEATACET